MALRAASAKGWSRSIQNSTSAPLLAMACSLTAALDDLSLASVLLTTTMRAPHAPRQIARRPEYDPPFQ